MSDLLATMERLREAQELERLRSEVKRLRREVREMRAYAQDWSARYQMLASRNAYPSYSSLLNAAQAQALNRHGAAQLAAMQSMFGPAWP
jgi:hypothetical protein